MEIVGTVYEGDSPLGAIERHTEDPLIQVVIRSNRALFRDVQDFLNRAIREKRPIVGGDGKLQIITQLRTGRERRTVATKIQSLSEGRLRVEYMEQTGGDSR